MSGHVERLKAWLTRDTVNRPLRDRLCASYEEAPLNRSDLRGALAELEQLRLRNEKLEAVLIEGSQRDRALALLLLRSGGQVEFTLAERVGAPQDGEFISYPNEATDGLVLAFQVADAAPQQSGPELFADACDCDCQPGQPCLCPERDCYCGPCRVCGENPQQPERGSDADGAE